MPEIRVLSSGSETWKAIESAARRARHAKIGVAYVTRDRAEQLLTLLRGIAAKKQGSVELVCGLGDDLQRLELDTVKAIAQVKESVPSGGTFGIVPPSDGIFHPKFYYFDDGDRADIIVGSSNLTTAGFEANTECNVHLTVECAHPIARQCRLLFREWSVVAKDAADLLRLYRQYHGTLSTIRAEMKALPPAVVAGPSEEGLSIEERVAMIAGQGSICEVTLDDSSLRIALPSEFLNRRQKPRVRSKWLEVSERQFIHWWLLDNPERIAKLRRRITFEFIKRQRFGFHTRWGIFVPHSQFPKWIEWIGQLDSEADALIKTSVQALRGRTDEIVARFRREFRKSFGDESRSNEDKLARELRGKLTRLRGESFAPRLIQPRWRRASVSSLMPDADAGKEQRLRRRILRITSDVRTRDLAEFSRVAARKARGIYKAANLRPGSAPAKCRIVVDEARAFNFYGDVDLEEWCCAVDRASRKRRLANADQAMAPFIQRAEQLLAEVDKWRYLSPDKVLAKFVACLRT